MAARRFISWPSDIKPINQQPRQRVFVSRATESLGGIDDGSEMRATYKRTYENDFIIPNEQSYRDWKFQWLWLGENVKGESGRIYYGEGSERWFENIRSGPPADGSRDTFPVPLLSASDGPYVKVNGVWDSAATISSVRANLLTDNEAISDTDLSGILVAGSCALTRAPAYRYYYGNSIQASPIGTVASFGVKTDKKAVLADWPTTAVFWATGPEPLEVQARVSWFDALDAQIGSTVLGTAVSLVPGEWVPAWVTDTAPSNAVTAVFRYLTTTTTDQPWWSDCRGAMLFGDPWWWLPSEATYSALLSSAPSDGALVEVSGSGLWQTLCKPRRDLIEETERPQGHIYPALDLVEAWEPSDAW